MASTMRHFLTTASQSARQMQCGSASSPTKFQRHALRNLRLFSNLSSSHAGTSAQGPKSTSRNSSTKSSSSAPLKSPSQNKNPSVGEADFRSMFTGTNRTVKVVVLVCLSIFATMESIFWVKVTWAWLFPPVEEERHEGAVRS
jgi:hypothetical protein